MDVEATFERIVRDHGPALARLARGYSHDAADAQDLLQDILFAVWRALPRFRGDCSERTFVFRVGHNRGITHRARRRPHLALDAAGPLPDPRADAEAGADRTTERERLMRGVGRLPPDQRAVVMLYLEGFSHREIADVLGTTENGAAARLSRARKALREFLSPGEGGHG